MSKTPLKTYVSSVINSLNITSIKRHKGQLTVSGKSVLYDHRESVENQNIIEKKIEKIMLRTYTTFNHGVSMLF